MIGVKKALTHWLDSEASPADDVTIVTTSGDLSWNDRVATGREDLLGILGRVTGGMHPIAILSEPRRGPLDQRDARCRAA